MTGRTLIFLSVLGFCAYSLQKNAPPIPPDASKADSVAAMNADMSARFQYGFGIVGCKLVGGWVTESLVDTEQALHDMRVALKNTKGGDGTRARAYADRVRRLSAESTLALEYGHPIIAVRKSMEATNLVGAVKAQLER